MEQLVREETHRHLANQMREARLQRQKQVRQQALAWTEATRKKFEESKAREIKGLANVVTGQVQNAAIKNIEDLTRRNDLAMAEIGMAHRAAAGYQNVERLKSLKRLKNDEVANNRGSKAMMRQLKQKEAERSKAMALVKRKEDVRKSEDMLSKDLIIRRPLKATNSNIDKKKPSAKLGPPEYQQSIAKTLKVASATAGNQREDSPRTAKAKTPAVVNPKPVIESKKMREKRVSIVASSSSDLMLQNKEEKPKEGMLTKMVRIKTTSPETAGLNFYSETAKADFTTLQDLYDKGYTLRREYQAAARGDPFHVPTSLSLQSNVRYFDATIPKGEVKYVAPLGLAVKEARKSPDAWEKGRKTSEESLQYQKSKALKKEEISQKATERGKLAMKKAKLEKEIMEVRNELLEEIDFQFLGTGSQKAILGLVENSNGKAELVDQSSDEFSAVDSDEEFIFPSPRSSTLKKYNVENDDNVILTLKPVSLSKNSLLSQQPANKKIEESSSTDSFASYSAPSLDSIEDGSPENQIRKQQKSSDLVADNNGKVSPQSKRESANIQKRRTDDNLESGVKRRERPSLATVVDSALPEKKKEYGPESVAEDEGSPRRKSSPASDNDRKLKSKKLTGSRPSRRSDHDIHRRRKSKPSSELMASAKDTKPKDSFVSEGSYSPPSLRSSKTKVIEKPKSKKQHRHSAKEIGSKNEALDFPSEDKDKTESDESIANKKSVEGRSTPDKIVDAATTNQSGKPVKSEDGVKSATSIHSSKSLVVSNASSLKSQSDSTLAEINVRASSATEAIPANDKISSLQELQDRAKVQERLLQESLSVSTSVSGIQDGSSRHSTSKATISNSSSNVSRQTSQTRKQLKKRDESSRKSSQPNKSSSTDSDQSSALVNIKIKKVDDSKSETSGTHFDTTRSNSDESSALVNLKVIEKSDSTPTRSEVSSSGTTDYYSPPDGPFTSTPDGKLHPKSNLPRSSDGELSLDDLKRLALQYYLDKFLNRRPDSIEHLPVSSSSSSVIRTESDVLETDSFPGVVDDKRRKRMSMESTPRSRKYSGSDSSNGATNKGLSTLQEEQADHDQDSGTTIAETAIIAGRIFTERTTTSTNTGSSLEKDESSLATGRSSSSHNGTEPVSSDSLTGLLRVLSGYQEIEKHQLDYHIVNPGELDQSSVRTSHHAGSNNQDQSNLHSSRDSIPDASAILRRLISRQQVNDRSRSSALSSPKSGPERETKRVELLDDVKPIELWETPPSNQIGANDTEKLSAVFETLIDKWSNMRIEKPPWNSSSDSSRKDGR